MKMASFKNIYLKVCFVGKYLFHRMTYVLRTFVVVESMNLNSNLDSKMLVELHGSIVKCKHVVKEFFTDFFIKICECEMMEL